VIYHARWCKPTGAQRADKSHPYKNRGLLMKHKQESILNQDRFFDSDTKTRHIARELYDSVKRLPLVCPHTHVDPALFSDKNSTLGNPTDLFIKPDHYLFRMLYSQGIRLERLGIQTRDNTPVEQDPKKIWQLFADNFYLYRCTPTGAWLSYEFVELFGITQPLTGKTAQSVYDIINKKLQSAGFTPRKLYDKFNIEVLCTTDDVLDTLSYHNRIKSSGWNGRILPTFRPDSVINIKSSQWRDSINKLSELTGITVTDYKTYIRAIQSRRDFFRSAGAAATDLGTTDTYTGQLSDHEVQTIFQSALKGQVTDDSFRLFTGHMVMEMARMSIDDGLVMQWHPGVYRNHNRIVFDRFGPDKGCDIPIHVEFTRNLVPLLNEYGNDPRLTLVLFTLDDTTYGRELAPLAGHYPALKLGPAWWFNDSINGMLKYKENIVETAGLYNTAGFNDDTRSFPSIPARHDLSRRIDASWLARLVSRHIISVNDGRDMIKDCAYNLAKKTYKL
jgi:glucuronate isomerase